MQGTTCVVLTWQVGTGHRITGQSPGVVILVTVGQGIVDVVLVVVIRGGRVTTLVMTLVV